MGSGSISAAGVRSSDQIMAPTHSPGARFPTATRRSVLLPLALPFVILGALALYGLLAPESQRSLRSPGSQGALVWGDGIFANKTELKAWIRLHGGSYSEWLKLHPSAKSLLVEHPPTLRGGRVAGGSRATHSRGRTPGKLTPATRVRATGVRGETHRSLWLIAAPVGALSTALLLGAMRLLRRRPGRTIESRPTQPLDGTPAPWPVDPADEPLARDEERFSCSESSPQPRWPESALGEADFERCEIVWWRGYVKSQFQAVTSEGDLVAASRFFAWRRKSPPPESTSIAEHLADLLRALEDAGWTREGIREGWFAARFQRPAWRSKMPPVPMIDAEVARVQGDSTDAMGPYAVTSREASSASHAGG
jgi:hypothetical protein